MWWGYRVGKFIIRSRSGWPCSSNPRTREVDWKLLRDGSTIKRKPCFPHRILASLDAQPRVKKQKWERGGLSQQQLKQVFFYFQCPPANMGFSKNVWSSLSNPSPTAERFWGSLMCDHGLSSYGYHVAFSVPPHGLQGVADACHRWSCLSMWATSPQAVTTDICPESSNYCG